MVSGINKGANLGDDVTYSGTVSAAMEGTLLGIPSLAISLAGRTQFDFAPAAEFAARLVAQVLERGLPADTLLNVNVPDRSREAHDGVSDHPQGKRRFGEALVEKTDPRGKKYYWIGGEELGFVDEPGTDYAAILEGAVSITPIHLDLTHYPSFATLETLARWMAMNFERARGAHGRGAAREPRRRRPAGAGGDGQGRRHRFVAEALQVRAYDDKPLPIGERQTISQPYMVGLMTQALALRGRRARARDRHRLRLPDRRARRVGRRPSTRSNAWRSWPRARDRTLESARVHERA